MTIEGRAIDIKGAVQERSKKAMYKTDTKYEAKRFAIVKLEEQ